jgi:mannosyltransferase
VFTRNSTVEARTDAAGAHRAPDRSPAAPAGTSGQTGPPAHALWRFVERFNRLAVPFHRWSASVSDPAFLAAMAGVAVALRAPRLAIAYWGDEAISVGIASRPLSQIPAYLHFDGSPPIYYVVLHYWIRLFGNSPVATHALSLLISLLVIPTAWWCARALFGSEAARPAAVMAAVCPYLAYYGTETRMYALVALASMPAVTGFVRAMRSPPPVPRPADASPPSWWSRLADDPANRWLALGVAGTLAVLYTHNWGLFLTAALLIAGLGIARWQAGGGRSPAGRLVLRRVVVFGAAVAAGYAPWLPSFFWQLRYTGAPWAPRPGVAGLFVNTLDATFSATIWSVEATREVVGPGGRIDPAYLTLWLACVGLVVAALVRHYRRRPPDAGRSDATAAHYAATAAEKRRRLAATGAVVVTTLVLAWASSQVVHAWASRYLGVVVAPLLLVIAGAVCCYRWAGRLFPALTAVMTVFALPVLVDPPAAFATKSNVAQVDGAMRSRLAPDDLVISTAPSELPVIAYYLPAGMRYASVLGPVRNPQVVDWIDLTGRLAAADPKVTLARIIHELPAGARVLLVNPINWATTETPRQYAGVVAAAGIAVNQMVLTDPDLTVIHTVIPRHPGASSNPVEGVLLVKGR